MTDFFFRRNDIFPVGTSVGAYDGQDVIQADGTPPTTDLLDTQTMTDAGLTFTDLPQSGQFWAVGLVGSEYKWMRFFTSPPTGPFTGPQGESGADGAAGTDGADGAAGEPGAAGAGFEFTVTDDAYGAVGDGVADDTAAIQAAIDAAKAAANASGSGTVYFPQGIYLISSALDVNDAPGIRLLGAGGRKQYSMGPTIRFSGTSGNAMTTYRSHGVTVESLRFEYTSASYTGDLVDVATSGGDTQQFKFIRCGFQGNTGGATTAETLIRMNYAIIGSIEDCHFGQAKMAAQCGDGNYCVGVQIFGCTFNFLTEAPIQCNAGAEKITVGPNNSFEPIAAQAAGALKLLGGSIFELSYIDNWHGDVGASAGGSWIRLDTGCTWFGGYIMGNRFAGGAGSGGGAKVLSFGSSSPIMQGVVIAGNNGDSIAIDFASCGNGAGSMILGNYGISVSNYSANAGLTYDQGRGFFPGFFHPIVGIGMDGADPVYALDIRSALKAGVRLLDGSLYFGGTAGNADADVSLGRGAAKRLDLGSDHQLRVGTVAAASAASNSLFVDSGTGKLSYKDAGGTTNALY